MTSSRPASLPELLQGPERLPFSCDSVLLLLAIVWQQLTSCVFSKCPFKDFSVSMGFIWSDHIYINGHVLLAFLGK